MGELSTDIYFLFILSVGEKVKAAGDMRVYICPFGRKRSVGCCTVEWKFPEETGFYQPIVVARKE